VLWPIYPADSGAAEGAGDPPKPNQIKPLFLSFAYQYATT